MDVNTPPTAGANGPPPGGTQSLQQTPHRLWGAKSMSAGELLEVELYLDLTWQAS